MNIEATPSKTTSTPIPIRDIASQLFKEIAEEWNTVGEISDSLIRDVITLFPSIIYPAFDIVDRRNVKKLISPSGRYLYQVASKSDQWYPCMLEANYCPCPSYQFSVVNKDEWIMCKHLLATNLAISLDYVLEISVPNQRITQLLSEL